MVTAADDSDDDWLEKADESMKAKGTKGAFGKATKKKIASGKKEGGLQKKRAVFAQNALKASGNKKKGPTIKR